jgi:hypothetical protein
VNYSILTFGCRVNQADSMAIERDLRARGGVAVQSADADVIVVNSCSVTATADQGTRQAIRRAARDNPRARIVVTGCYATRCPDEVAALPGVVAVAPNAEKETLVVAHVPFLNTTPGVGTVPCAADYSVGTRHQGASHRRRGIRGGARCRRPHGRHYRNDDRKDCKG